MKKTSPLTPLVLTIFGASGDLAKLKLFPALYELKIQKLLPEKFLLVGFARTEKSDEGFRNEISHAIRKKYPEADPVAISSIIENSRYLTGQYTEPASFADLGKLLEETGFKKEKHLAYFSVHPSVYASIAENLASAGLEENTSLIIEKPFGENTVSARELFHRLNTVFAEEKIFFLDHYLGKAAVESILHLRHANRLLNLVLKGEEVANIQITAFEKVGISERAGYFENTGIIKDMIQSHLLQTLALITMNIPIEEKPESVHRERGAVLSALLPPESPKDIVIGQYESYLSEPNVDKKSQTETFVAVRLKLDLEEWHNVPIYLRTGKKTSEKHTFVVVELKKFPWQKAEEEPNRLIIEIQPEEKISIKLQNRLGPNQSYQEITTADSLACSIDGCLPDHANLIKNALDGKKTNFLSEAEILACWRVTDNLIKKIQEEKIKLRVYADGADGPEEQNNLPENDGFAWYDLH